MIDPAQMVSSGIVREFHPEEGWGVIDGPDVPGGCWVHFSAIAMAGHRALTPGQAVSFHSEAARQDGYAYRAVLVWPPGDPADRQVEWPRSVAYRSSLTLTFDPPDEPR